MPDEVTPDYVRARWAYSELLSWGHGHLYQGPGVQDLKEKLALRCHSTSWVRRNTIF